MIGELTESQIDQVLREEMIGRIGCHAERHTYVVPVTYVFDATSIYGLTGNGLKVRMMRENPNVCFEVDQLNDLPNWRSVILSGRFEELREGAEAANALRLLADHVLTAKQRGVPVPSYGSGRTVPNGEECRPRETTVYAIRILGKTGRFELSESG